MTIEEKSNQSELYAGETMEWNISTQTSDGADFDTSNIEEMKVLIKDGWGRPIWVFSTSPTGMEKEITATTDGWKIRLESDETVHMNGQCQFEAKVKVNGNYMIAVSNKFRVKNDIIKYDGNGIERP